MYYLRNVFFSIDRDDPKTKTEEIEFTEFIEIEEDEVPLGI